MEKNQTKHKFQKILFEKKKKQTKHNNFFFFFFFYLNFFWAIPWRPKRKGGGKDSAQEQESVEKAFQLNPTDLAEQITLRRWHCNGLKRRYLEYVWRGNEYSPCPNIDCNEVCKWRLNFLKMFSL